MIIALIIQQTGKFVLIRTLFALFQTLTTWALVSAVPVWMSCFL